MIVRKIALILAAALPAGCQLTSDMPYKSTLEAIAVREDQRVGVEEIRPYLEYDNDGVRLRAAMAFARLRNPDAVDFISLRLDVERDHDVAETLLFALGQIGSSRASDTVLKFFASPIDSVRASAVEAAGKLNDPALTVPIMERLNGDDSALVKAEACLALFRLGAKRYMPKHGLKPDVVAGRREALSRALEEDPSPAVRWRAAYALAGIEDPESDRALRTALVDDEDAWVRCFAARGLRSMPPGQQTQKALTEACNVARENGEWNVVVEAISALGNYADLETAAFLINFLLPDRRNNFHIRATAARTLGRFGEGGETIVKALLRATDDPSHTVVGEAIVALGALPLERTTDILKETAGSSDRYIRRKTVEAAREKGSEATDILLELAMDVSIRVRCAALEALLDPVFAGSADEIVPLAEEAVFLDDMSLRYAGAQLLQQLGSSRSVPTLKAAYARSPGLDMAEARLKIIEAVAALGGPEDDAFFRKAVEDDDFMVRNAAAKALASISGELLHVDPAVFKSQLHPRVGEDYMNNEPNPVAHLVTSKGEFWIELFNEDAPTHVLNFIRLAESGFYNKLTFHRVVSNFVVQGLDPRGDGWGFGDLRQRDEINRRKFLQGYVGMPNSGRDTGGCQIFITHCPTPHLDGNYTVFGRVIAGMQVVDKIEEGDRVFRINIK